MPTLEPMISYHRLVEENGKQVFKPMAKLDFGSIAGHGDSDELEFYIWNNYNGTKDVPNLQLPKLSIQAAIPPSGSDANNIEIINGNWLSVREHDSPVWNQLGKDTDGSDLELLLSRKITGFWNEGEPSNPETSDNFIHMAAKISVPMNADITLPYIFDIKVTGKYV